jgi:hypothetical protein
MGFSDAEELPHTLQLLRRPDSNGRRRINLDMPKSAEVAGIHAQKGRRGM